ncbi:putative aldouronate transport system permease protein [Kribbella amoyensis]|uniref:Putative aldouronate transport system permease protein n=1 Tax=Kribbella amoyensis TaxID=996641 RepID=A0A561BUW0_9ACTN|nr:ABC transporter permease subunit [Kribbella amoyensis]TWD82601.1 putative aldouronate transport system permease protein [Kribbella amoyensis]
MTDLDVARPPRATAGNDAGAPTKAKPTRRSLFTRLRRDYPVLLLAIPGLLIILAFQYYPLLGNVIAFQDYQPYLGIDQSLWVGIENFRVLFDGDPEFLNAVKNTLILTAIQTIIVFPAPIVVAIVLHSLLSNRLRQFVQSVIYLPHFMSWVIVVAVFQQVLGGTGMINNWLRTHGYDPINVIGNVEAFRALLTAQVLWKDTGWATILFLAVLSQIDRALYEASAVDGATRWRQTWHVTLPGLRPIIILLLILKLGDSLTVGFEQIILQQQAVGADVSEVLDTYVYNNGIIGGNWGVAAAVGLAKSAVALALVLAANKVAHRFGEEGVYRG